MTLPNAITQLQGTDPATGQTSATVTSVRLLGPLRRTIGLAGDVLEVAVKRSAWPPANTDITAEGVWLIRAGDEADSITLDGYNLLGVEPLNYGKDFPAGVEVSAQQLKLTLATAPYRLRDGRGGTLRVADNGGVLNPLTPAGLVDETHAAYRTNSQLVQLCLSAIGWAAFTPLPATLDEVPPPAPLDWGNARALPELEALLARAGHGLSFYSEAEGVVIFKLPRAGSAVTVPQLIQDQAEPYELTPGPGLRASLALISSGQTRTMIVAARSIAELEFVAFDERTGRWLNDDEWTALYDEEPGPSDIERFRMGAGKTPEERREFARLFTALRLPADDETNGAPILTIRDEVATESGLVIGGAPATAVGIVAEELAPGQFRNPPMGTPPELPGRRIEGVRVEAAERVFIFPEPLVKMASATGDGTIGEAAPADTLTVIFAHEARTGVYADDFFVRVHRSVDGTVEAITDPAEAAQAIAHRDTLHAVAPFLQRVARVEAGDEGDELVFLNDAELNALALSLAEIRVRDAAALAGVVPVRGLIDGLPGDWAGAVTSVEWAIAERMTYFYVNEHEAPGSVFEARESAARRSIAAGLSRFSLPGSSAGASDVRATATPTIGSTGQAAPRGAERQGEQKITASPAAPNRVEPQRLLARITAATPMPGAVNRWLYSWEEEAIRDDLSGAPGGPGTTPRTDDTLGVAINLAEVHNTGAGVQGNGVDIDGLPDGFELKPIAEGRLVWLEGPVGPAGGETMLFNVTNAVDGECPTTDPAPEAETTQAGGYLSGADELLALAMSGRGV